MSNSSEKNLLKNIKQSIEKESPNIWSHIHSAQTCKYILDQKPSTSNMQRIYMPAAAVVLCVFVTFGALKIKLFNHPGNTFEYTIDSKGEGLGTTAAPGVPESTIGRDTNKGTPEIYRLYTKDADVDEASKALKFNIVAPTWVPEGFTKTSAQLYANSENGSNPYMYHLEYSTSAKKILIITITKAMTDEEKSKMQPEIMPIPIDKGEATKNQEKPSSDMNSTTAVQALPPDYQASSVPPYNPSEPAAPTTSAAEPTLPPQTGKDTPGSSKSSGGSIGSSGNSSSIEFAKIKIKTIDVSMSIMASSSNEVISASWVYNGGNYNISTDGISKEAMTKIIESMIA